MLTVVSLLTLLLLCAAYGLASIAEPPSPFTLLVISALLLALTVKLLILLLTELPLRLTLVLRSLLVLPIFVPLAISPEAVIPATEDVCSTLFSALKFTSLLSPSAAPL